VAEVVGLVQRAHRHGHGAQADGAQEGERERRRVVEHQQHALLAGHAERPEQVAHAVDLAAQLAVGQRRVRRQEGRLVGPAALHLPVDDLAGVVGHPLLTTTDFLSV
jgi:hypothetical protein